MGTRFRDLKLQSQRPHLQMNYVYDRKQAFLEMHVFNVYLLPNACRTPFASLRRSWRRSGTFLSCCQASPKCLSVLLGRFSASLGSLLRHSVSFLSSSCWPASPPATLFPILERCGCDLTTTLRPRNLINQQQLHNTPHYRMETCQIHM